MPIKKISKKTKKVAVNRKFLLRLADRIYNPSTKQFLRLCDGKLQNGPDPTDEARPMHCGLGELYFAMTGKEPEETGVDEGDVVNLAVKLSPIAGLREEADKQERIKYKRAQGIVKRLDLDGDVKETLVDTIQKHIDCVLDEDKDEDDRDDVEHDFRAALHEIPGENDDGCGHNAEAGKDDYGYDLKVCTVANFRDRSKRVASKLREAAKILPA